VGDADFQKKAIKKMQDVSEEKGRTVLFVSHNMESIRRLCNRVIVMAEGNIVQDGNTEESINKYLGEIAYTSRNYKNVVWKDLNESPGGDIVKLRSISVKDLNENLRSQFILSEEIIVEIEF